MMTIAQKIDVYCFKDHFLLVFLSVFLAGCAMLLEWILRWAGYPTLAKFICFPWVILVTMLYAGAFSALRPYITLQDVLSMAALIYAGLWAFWLTAYEPIISASDLGAATITTLAGLIGYKMSPRWHRWCDVRDRAMRIRIRTQKIVR